MYTQRASLRVAFYLLLLSFAVSSPAAASQPQSEAARVIAVTPGAFVQRGGAQTPLKLKDVLYKSDQVSTDDTGKVQLLFTDDSVVAIAPGTVVNLTDFSFGGPAKASFSLKVGQGLARVVTGQVVRQNREGFKVTTPHATVGIRGTILAADVRNPSQSKFILSQLGAGHTVSVLNTATGQQTEMGKSGFTMEVGASGNTLRPATPVELNTVQTVTRQTRQIPRATYAASNAGGNTAAQTAVATPGSSRTSRGSSTPGTMPVAGAEDATGAYSAATVGGVQTSANLTANAPDSKLTTIQTALQNNPATNSGNTSPQPDGDFGSGGGSVPPDSSSGSGDIPNDGTVPGGDDLNGDDLNGDVTPDGGLTPGGDLTPGAGDNPGALDASYAGSLGGSLSGQGSFSFDANLGSGELSNGVISVQSGHFNYLGNNGSGQLDLGSSQFGLDFNEVTEFNGETLTGHKGTGAIEGQISEDRSTVDVSNWHVTDGGHNIVDGTSGQGVRQ